MGIFNSSGGRRFLGVACGALLVAVGFRCWEDRFSDPQRLRAISTEIIRHGGSCSNGNGSLTATTDIDGRSSVRYHDMRNKFSVGLDKTGTVVASQGDAKGPALPSPIGSHDIPKVLSFMERAVVVLCSGSPNNTPTDTDNESTFLIGSFLEQGPQNA